MSDLVTLIAGILLTSVGLIALSPFFVRLVRTTNPFVYGSGRLLPSLSDADVALPFASDPEVTISPDDGPPLEGAHALEELLAHLFGLRMIVGEVRSEVQAVQDVLAGAGPEQDAEIHHLYALDEDAEEYVA